jgi:ankyrin repeat protein
MNMSQLSETTLRWLETNHYRPEDLNHRGENGDTALMKATRTGETEIVRELIGAEVDLDLRNNDGNNALWFACFGNYHDLIQLLVDAGIDIDNQNDNGATALMYAASAGKTPVVQRLLQAGANLELKTLDDFQAVDLANNVEILRILRDATAN